jgi:ribosome biogenesis GTPase / thiamine phosphate phosphatase
VNGLLGTELCRTNTVRLSDGRGQHTTTSRELIALPGGGVVIDTPGMRELQLWAGQESVDETFDEIATLAAGCRFRDCAHSGERGCAVAEALKNGTLSEERWNSYRKLTAEVRRHQQQTDRVAAAAAKKSLKALHRGIRAFYRHNGR